MHDGHTCIQMRWWGEEGGNVYEQSTHTMSSTEKKKTHHKTSARLHHNESEWNERETRKKNIPGTRDADASRVSGVIAVPFRSKRGYWRSTCTCVIK